MKILDIQEEFLPDIAGGECIIGETVDHIPVAVSLGDNQASFLGSVNTESNLLVNIGTGSQMFVYSSTYVNVEGMECRSYIDGTY